MSTVNIPNPVSSTTKDTTTGSRTEDRARLVELAAEFESMLLASVLRDMRTSGRWSGEDAGRDMLGAETFDQTIDVELSRYLSKAGGFGLSERLLSAFDALARIADAAPAGTRQTASTADGTSAPQFAAGGSAPATTGEVFFRTGWNGMKLDPPTHGGSGAEWAGFNVERALAGGDDNSVKDAFCRWTYGQSFNPSGKSKEDIEAFFRSNMQSAREYGLNILDVKGEQILIETAERGPEWVDVVQNAGAPGARWQWLTQMEFGAPTGGGALGAALADLRSAPDGEARVRSVMASNSATGDALLSSLKAERQAAATGAPVKAATTARATETASVAADNTRTRTAQITSPYGWRQDPFSGATSFHRGVDLRAAEGDPVAATGAGKVVFAGENGGYGTSVVVEHANGLSTRYAHLSAALVNLGDMVENGQILGLAGQTGRATGPHVHYEVMVDGVAVDPIQQ